MKLKRSDELREVIEEEITMGRIAPGSRLDEAALCARFGVSRTPIREALIHLASSGLVEIHGRRGTFVSVPAFKSLFEMFEIMAELEAICAKRAARRITPEQQNDLLAAHEACRVAHQSGDPDVYFHENERFHEAIYLASNNVFLGAQATNLQRRLRPYRRLQLRIRGRVNTSFAEHEEMVSAILSGDGDRAAECTLRHVVMQGERFSDLMASLDRLQESSATASTQEKAAASAGASDWLPRLPGSFART